MPTAPESIPDPTPVPAEQRTFEAGTAEEAMDAASDEDGHLEESSYTSSESSPTDDGVRPESPASDDH